MEPRAVGRAVLRPRGRGRLLQHPRVRVPAVPPAVVRQVELARLLPDLPVQVSELRVDRKARKARLLFTSLVLWLIRPSFFRVRAVISRASVRVLNTSLQFILTPSKYILYTVRVLNTSLQFILTPSKYILYTVWAHRVAQQRLVLRHLRRNLVRKTFS